MHVSITKSEARHLLLTKQLLLSPRSLIGPESIDTVFQKLRLIQYDPLNPCGRNTDLVLQARIKDYHPNEYYEWLYKEKKGIECYDKELCTIPIEDFSLTHLRRDAIENRQETKVFLRRYQTEVEELLENIKKRGPLTSSDFPSTLRVKSGWGTEATFNRIALELLWKMGRLIVVNRANGKKLYDLSEKHHSGLAKESHFIEASTEHVKRRLQSVGILPRNGGGGGWQGIGRVKKIIDDLVIKGELIEVMIRGSNRKYVIHAYDRTIIQKQLHFPDKKITFIAPLDNLLWDREMIEDFFDFQYRWEVYTPIHKRSYGYYVLPILYGNMFIGRIEPVHHDGTLTIKGIWKEKNVTWDRSTMSRFHDALEHFQQYLQAKEIRFLDTKVGLLKVM